MEQLESRASFIEREYDKWRNQYEIGFEQEFEVKALLSLQYQFLATPNEHVKTLGDIINTINQIKKNLNLKTKINNNEQTKILVIADIGRKYEMFQLFYSLLQHHTIFKLVDQREIETKSFRISFTSNPEIVRGTRADYIIDLTKQHTSTDDSDKDQKNN